MPLATGTHLGPYQILAPLGAGGMGEVYRAHDSRLERQVAIKVLPEQLSQSPQALARFVRETKAVAALSHSNILAIFDTGIENGISYSVTELLEGETLRANLLRGPLPWRKAVEIGGALAEGLAAAHSKSITHRDLKPENIFLTADGRLKILDFGLARVEGAQTDADADTQTEAGTVLGTPALHVARTGPRHSRRPYERHLLVRVRAL
jgi:serine/threonine protein kinase